MTETTTDAGFLRMLAEEEGVTYGTRLVAIADAMDSQRDLIASALRGILVACEQLSFELEKALERLEA